jgi:hypothetical protein
VPAPRVVEPNSEGQTPAEESAPSSASIPYFTNH